VKEPILVAHRGWISRYPENTLLALTAALERGAKWLEVDVQLSADRVPVLFHDRTLRRCTGKRGSVGKMDFALLRELGAGEPRRFGERFADQRIPSLAEFAELLARWSEARALVEIKRVSLERFGVEPVLDAVLAVLAPVLERCTLISFSRELVEAARARGQNDTGWIIESFDHGTMSRARELAPALLVADRKILPPGDEPLPDGPWRWAIYTVDEPAEARALAARGASIVETDSIGEYLDALDRDGGQGGEGP